MSIAAEYMEMLSSILPALSTVLSVVIFASFVAAFFKFFFQTLRIPISNKIAIIGLPAVGKTTLITAMFEVIQRGGVVPNTRLHGLKTISTVNKYISMLVSGVPIGPTHEKDVFLFRFSYRKNISLWIPRTYDIEIADFPGEYSEEISSGSEKSRALAIRSAGRRVARQEEEEEEGLDFTLFHREFFSWIASSSAYVFVVDLSAVYGDANPDEKIGEISARIRTSWQVIEDATSERGIGSVRSRKVHLVFTKLDSLITSDQTNGASASLQLLTLGPKRSAENVEQISQMREVVLQAGKKISGEWSGSNIDSFALAVQRHNDANFTDLIQFFKTRVRRVEIHYISMAIRDERRLRYGVNRMVGAVLP